MSDTIDKAATKIAHAFGMTEDQARREIDNAIKRCGDTHLLASELNGCNKDKGNRHERRKRQAIKRRG